MVNQIAIRMKEKMIEDIDEYRASEGCNSISDAARDLIRTSLRAWKKEKANDRC